MKVHYFNQAEADKDDMFLNMAKRQGYVPMTCLLGGQTVMGIVSSGANPCNGCECDRSKCHGKTKK